MEQNHQPDAKLLALLEKMARPIERCAVNLEVQGIFALPDEWKVADDANPNLFSYKIHFEGLDVAEGKIVARELTEQEKKDLEEAQNKKKGGAPKEKKGKDDAPQLTPEEQERLQKLEEEKLEAERIAQEEWDALSDQEKFYRTNEDKYKKDSLKFENNIGVSEKEGEDLVIFEENVETGGAWMSITKFPTATEEEIVKMRKSKPKNLNLLDLNPCTMKAWIDLSGLQTPGTASIVCRAKIERAYNPEDKPEELPNPNLENTYILVKIDLDPPITPLVEEIQPRVEDMIPRPLPIPQMPASKNVINEYKGQLVLIMESLAMEYAAMFGKDANNAQEPKGKQHLSEQQRRDIREQKKEKFIQEFNSSGKFNILKDKIKKSIMKVIRDKFQKTGSLTPLTPESKDQFYSELYTFFNEQMRQTLNDLVQEKTELHEDLRDFMKTANKERQIVNAAIQKESEAKRQLRLANENEIINNLIESEKAFKNLLAADRENHENPFLYCEYLLRRKNFPKAEEMLLEALNLNTNRVYVNLLAVLQARRGRKQEAIIGLNSLLDKDPFDSLPNTLMSFIYTKLMNEPKLGRKYLAISQRILMRKLNLLPPKASPQSMILDQGPVFKMPSMQQQPDENVAKKIVLSEDQNDEIWIEAAEYLVRYNIYDLAEQVIEEIKEKSVPKVEFFKAKIAFMKGDVNLAIEILDRLIKLNPKSAEYLLTKANYCFEKDKFYEAEETFLQAFKLRGPASEQKNNPVKTFPTFLRLGYTFLYRKAWTDAKTVLTQATEEKPNSSLAWLGLGIACLRTGEFKEGEQALNQANIYDHLNAEVWGYLALLCLQDANGSRVVQANQALKEMIKCDLKNAGLLEELADTLASLGKFELAETLYKKLLDNWQNDNLAAANNVGAIHAKLAKVYHVQERLLDARMYYTEAMNYLEGETDRERIGVILADIGQGINNVESHSPN
jgi:tetratricopeptide (TPR) repeat protein